MVPAELVALTAAREVTFEPLEAAALEAWLDDLYADYVRHRIEAGDTVREAEANAAESRSRRVPDGSLAPDEHIGRVLSGGEPVGYLWVGRADDDPRRWWVVDVWIHEARRGEGLGRAAMRLAEEIARDRGATSLGLHVFASNAPARRLYASLGYEEADVTMRKSLSVDRS